MSADNATDSVEVEDTREEPSVPESAEKADDTPPAPGDNDNESTGSEPDEKAPPPTATSTATPTPNEKLDEVPLDSSITSCKGGGGVLTAGIRRILIITQGSRGDVQPYVALANHMVSHDEKLEVCLATHATLEPLVKSFGCPDRMKFFGLPGNPEAILQSEEFVKAFYEKGAMAQMKIMKKDHDEYAPASMRKVVDFAIKEYHPHCVLGSIVNRQEGLIIGQVLNIPVMCTSTIPYWPSAYMRPLGTGKHQNEPYETPQNKWVWASKFIAKVAWMAMGGPINEIREKYGLPKQTDAEIPAHPYMFMYSPVVFPRLKDYPDTVSLTGYWIVPFDPNYQPDEELDAFLKAGTPPIYMGFGSMPMKDVGKLVQAFTEVCKNVGKRGIYCGGWTTVEGLTSNETVLFIKGAPHEWLLPKCCMAIHHGGAGTTAASLRAGVPTIICDVLIDQPFWASRVISLGCGQTEFNPLKGLSKEALEIQVRRCTEDEVIQKAKEVGETLRSEKGCENATHEIMSFMNQSFWNQNPSQRVYETVNANAIKSCEKCSVGFGWLKGKKKCHMCGHVFCANCTKPMRLRNYSWNVPCCQACIKGSPTGRCKDPAAS